MFGWGCNVLDDLFSGTLRAFHLQRPSVPLRLISWSLDSVLGLLGTVEYCTVNCIDMLLSKCIFLLGLATGGRISELHALNRGAQYLAFSTDRRSVSLLSRYTFLAKNEHPLHRRDPIDIQGLSDEDGSPHVLCPVQALSRYLNVTKEFVSGPLFRNSLTGTPLAKSKCSKIICDLIKDSQPGSFPLGHDLRKMSTSLAFFRQMHLPEICQRVGWASGNVFIRHYLKDIQEVMSTCVVLGRPTS